MVLFLSTRAWSQCPPNIGFEMGTFDYWTCYMGTVSNINGSISVSPTTPIADRFVMLPNTFPQQLDPFGHFPVNCPNGSNYSIKLGNNEPQGHAEQVSYTFQIPAGQDNYSIIYNYAVVLENPPHQSWQQPGFISKVFDVTANQYITCGAFNFVAAGNLPGFFLSDVPGNATGSGSSLDVYYKPWSPITIKLVGYGGKTIRLEFTAHDCAPGGHFGYAYLDVNENCTSPVSGNVYCNGTNSITLTAPYGFSGYQWYPAGDYSQVLGTSNTLTISPPPPAGTKYDLVIVPYPGLGCQDTLHTTIQLSPDAFTLNVKSPLIGCSSATGVDITTPDVTAGSTPGLTYSYFEDAAQLNYMATPKNVTGSGTYYIKGVNSVGCNDIKPITVQIVSPPFINVTKPAAACVPGTVNITDPAIVAGSDPGTTYTYWTTADTTQRVPNPTAINTTGTYYIKGQNALGCSAVAPVMAEVGNVPTLVTHDLTVCGQADLTTPSVTAGSDPGITYTYWQDAAATIGLANTNAINTSNVYYIKASGQFGCSITQPVQVTINPYPDFTIDDPAPVTRPTKIDLTTVTTSPGNNNTYTYWKDSAATIPVPNPTMIDTSGTYYIQASNALGCTVTKPVHVVLKEPEIVPPNVFSPNGDAVNDTWSIPLLTLLYTKCTVEIFDRSGQPVFHSVGYTTPWDGTSKGSPLPQGTYYYIINLVNIPHAPISGSVTILR